MKTWQMFVKIQKHKQHIRLRIIEIHEIGLYG